MINNTARLEDRALTLKECFEKKKMLKAWKGVLEGLRAQPVLDLHDYYDFHRAREQKVEVIANQILDGSYRPKAPIIVRLEKKHGIARHLPIPSPDDAVVLQALTYYLTPFILKAQPSKRAYYSRTTGHLPSEESVDETFSYPWWKLWPEFQKRIYQFTTTFNYVVVTDIANYYDNISFRKLRNSLSSAGQFDEALLDLLFYLLESFLWRPDFLPLTGVGLPQLNFDAPRLLAHSFLFDIDKFLHKRTNGEFVRWMDDIDFGVQTIHEAKTILKELDEILLVKGLRLNMGKTKILSREDAKAYFLANENRWLSVMTKIIFRLKAAGKPYNTHITKIKLRFRQFLLMPRVGRWSKVYARYFTLASHINSNFLQNLVPDLLMHNPDIRPAIFRYYGKLGYSKARAEQIVEFYKGPHCTDEATIFSTAKLLVSWEIKTRSKARKVFIELANETFGFSKSHFVAALWLMAKYGLVTDICDVVNKGIGIWKYSSFVSRQVAAVLPRMHNAASEYQAVVKIISQSGHLDALNVLYHHSLLRAGIPSSGDTLYFTHGSGNIDVFPLQKIIMIENILSNNSIPLAQRTAFQLRVLPRLTDPIFRQIVQADI